MWFEKYCWYFKLMQSCCDTGKRSIWRGKMVITRQYYQMSRIWYIVHYNAPYVRHCLSALIPTTYSNISSDIEKSLKKMLLYLWVPGVKIQEQLLVEDILYVLLGINGKYVNVNHFSSEDHRWDKNILIRKLHVE